MLTETPPRHPSPDHPGISAAIARLQNGQWTRLEGAPETEDALRRFHDGGEIWYLSSGTAALEALLLGHEIGPGDEVIVPSYTWGATVSAVLAVGATPVFADIGSGAPVLDPESVATRIRPQTKAILCVHLFGFPCDMSALKSLADQQDLFLFEDGSQAHGATLNGKRVGRFGHGSAFSCMGMKPLAGTEGGYALFEDPDAAERAYLHGKHPRGLPPKQAEALQSAGWLDSLQLGWRPCAIGADLVRYGLQTLDAENTGRRDNARYLRTLLEEVEGVKIDPEPVHSEPVYHLLSFRLDEHLNLSPLNAIEVMSKLGLNGFHYIPTPIHQLPRIQGEGPPVFWHRQLKDAQLPSEFTSLPRTEARCRSSFEISWNWTQPNPKAMEQIASCFATLTSSS